MPKYIAAFGALLPPDLGQTSWEQTSRKKGKQVTHATNTHDPSKLAGTRNMPKQKLSHGKQKILVILLKRRKQ